VNTQELLDPCDRYGSLTDRAAVGEKLSPDETVWVHEHASTCAVCGTESAFYTALPDIMKRAPSKPEIAIVAAKPRRRYLRPLVLIAAALTVVGIAAAEFVVLRPSAPAPAAPPAVIVVPTVAAPIAAAPAFTAPAETQAEPAPTAVKRAAAPADTDGVSPDDLLREARMARAAGRASDATSTYKRLIRQFPQSPQAGPARVSLGDLELSLGDAASALTSYDAYLAGGQGAIAREARYGRIRALGALGHRADERREIEKFLHDYPSSSQAAALSAKLAPR
jgi:membrane-associated protease RseP (regulator of RpoE activity)